MYFNLFNNKNSIYIYNICLLDLYIVVLSLTKRLESTAFKFVKLTMNDDCSGTLFDF